MGNIKLINRKPVTATDAIIIVTHLLVAVATWIAYIYQLVQIDTLREIINMYFFIMPILLIGIFFRNLRNFNFYIIWVFIGIAQLFIYSELVGIHDFHYLNGSAFSGLKALLPTVVMFQFLRIIFIKTHGKEMIISIRHFRMSRWEDEENRNMTWVEVVFSMTLMLTTIIFNAIG